MTFCNIAKSYVRNNTFLAVKGEVFGIAANYFLDLKKKLKYYISELLLRDKSQGF